MLAVKGPVLGFLVIRKRNQSQTNWLRNEKNVMETGVTWPGEAQGLGWCHKEVLP